MPKTAAKRDSSPQGSAEGKATKKSKEADVETSTKSPFQKHLEQVHAYMRAQGKYVGCEMLAGEIEDYEDEDYTEEDMAGTRWLLLTKQREDMAETMKQLVLGEQYDDSIMAFSTSFSYQVESLVLDHFKRMYTKEKNWSKKFDMLLGLTINLSGYDVWMHDNEGGMGDVVKELAKMWKAILKQPSDKLFLDEKYSRPAVEAFLQEFKEKIEAFSDDYELGKFKYQ